MSDRSSAESRTSPPPAPRRRVSAGQAELAAIGSDRTPSLAERLLAPVAAVAVTIAVYGLLATSFATRLTCRDPDPS